MELEQIKAAWQREMAAYSYKIDPKAIMADTMQKAMNREREFNRQQRAQILCGFFWFVMMATRYQREGSLLMNAGLIVMLLCAALMLAGSVILKYRLRKSHPALPRDQFLAELRNKTEARIALLRRNMRWFMIPALLGLLAWQAGESHSVQMVAALAGLVAVGYAGVFWFYRWKLRNDFLPLIEEIDRELEYLRDHPRSRMD